MEEHQRLAMWDLLVSDAIQEAERRYAEEERKASKRAVQLAREQGYHRLALAIERPDRKPRDKAGPGQLCLFPGPQANLFEDPQNI